MQRPLLKDLDIERTLVSANCELIDGFDKKIQATLEGICDDEQTAKPMSSIQAAAKRPKELVATLS